MNIDWTIILTGLGIIIAIISVNFAMFSWLRSDIQDLKSEISADRRDILTIIRELQSEIKDFHGRLCKIEERRLRTDP